MKTETDNLENKMNFLENISPQIFRNESNKFRKVPDKLLYSAIFGASIIASKLLERSFPGYGSDVMYGVQAYSGCQIAGLKLSPFEGAVVGFVSNSLGEFCQHLGLFPGKFDLRDFVAYGIGSAISFGIEKYIRNNKRSYLES